MCLGPEMLLSAGLSAAGNFMNQRQAASNQQAKINASNNALRQELARQEQFQQQNTDVLNKTVDRFDANNQSTEQADLAGKREAAYEANAPVSSDLGNLNDGAPQVVKTDMAKRVADAVARSKASAKALAKIGSFGDLFQNNGLSINQAGNNIGTTNTLARGSIGVNQLEQRAAANNAGNKSSMFGDLLGAAGAGVGLYGAANGSGSIFGKTGEMQGPLQPGASRPVVNDPWGYVRVW